MNEQIVKVLRYIEINLDENLDIETLSSVAGYSPFHFCRLFKFSLGYSVQSYISKLKMFRATSNILNSDKSIIEIALDIGYKTPNGFNKAFKKVFNITPIEYRKRHLKMLLDYKEKRMNSPVIKQRDACSVVYVSEFGDYEKSESKAWEKLTLALNENISDAKFLEKCELLGFCHHDPETTPSQEIQYDAAIGSSSELINSIKSKELQKRQIPAGKFASITYKGDSQALNAWKDLYSWILEENLECRDVPAFEKYTNWSYGMDYEDLIVEIYVPLK